jgi:D-glycero-D-manno-heptose 1,7-bisphosphate phosphatase
MGINTLAQRAAVFLDRDGVINRNVFNPRTQAWESPLSPEDLKLPPDSMSAMRRLESAGFLLFVVSNQPNFAKGKASLQTLEAIHERLLGFLTQAGVSVSKFYYCLHHPDGTVPGYSGTCQCRKPSPYFLLRARDEFLLDFERSWMVGDRTSDIECGHAAGVRAIRILCPGESAKPSEERETPDFTVSSLEEAAMIILRSTQHLS